VLTEDTPDIRAAVEAIAAPESDDPEHNFRRLETTRLIQVALDQLPTHYGDALEWKYVYGFSVDEIAAKLGIGFEAAQSLLARAKRAFQEIYGALTVELRSNPGRNSPKTAAETP
jgi:RNA polymerase sigma-70 factor (ECF subfamily)